VNVEGFIKRIPAVRVLTIAVFDKSNGAEECIYSSSSSSSSDGYPYLGGPQQPKPTSTPNTSMNNGSSRKPYLERDDSASNSRVYSFDCFEISGLKHTHSILFIYIYIYTYILCV